MRHVLAAAFVILAALDGGLVIPATGAQQRPQDVALQAAMRTETVSGDLTAAIAQYRDIVEKYGKSDRAVAARALVRMAACYEKLGAAEAKKIYEEIVRDYADQKDAAATARAKLGNGAAASAAGERTIWSGGERIAGSVSRDGQWLAFVEFHLPAELRLKVRNLATGVDQVVDSMTDEQGFFVGAALSGDGSQIAYVTALFSGDTGSTHIRLASLKDRTAKPTPRVLYQAEKEVFLHVYDWSADGRRIAFGARDADKPFEVGYLDVASGKPTVLRTIDLRGPTEVTFSPDGKHLAYDRPASGRVAQRDVVVLPLSGGEERPIAATGTSERLVGWSHDGRHLLFATEGGGGAGTRHLLAQPMNGAAAQGDPVVVRRHTSIEETIGLTRAGALVATTVSDDEMAVRMAAVDFKTGGLVERLPSPVPNAWPRSRQPLFSPDGKSVAALSSGSRTGASERILSIQSLDGGQPRILPLRLQRIWTYSWSPDGRSFLARAQDFAERNGVFQIDAQTGDVKPLLLNDDTAAHFMPQWRPDGRTFVYATGKGQGRSYVMEYDVATASSRQLLHIQAVKTEDGRQLSGINETISPDGRYLALYQPMESTIWVITIADNTARPLYRDKAPRRFVNSSLSWTPDSSTIVLNAVVSESRRELWAIPLADGKPRTLDVGTQSILPEPIALHPDGRRIAFVTGQEPRTDLKVFENVLPVASTSKPSAR